MKSFDDLLKESVERHGHLCAGQIIGVRMAMLGCSLVGIRDPKDPLYRKKLIVYVEIDRCATDAIESVTGCRLGKRSMKFKDFGINAATFVNIDTEVAFRIVSTEESRITAKEYAPHAPSLRDQQIEGYIKMPDRLLFDIQQVRVDLPKRDLPGPPRSRIECSRCGQMVRDGKETIVEGKAVCKHCAGEGYFSTMENKSE